MLACDVRTQSDALAYLVDCTLATVVDMAMKKSRKKHEYERQIAIATRGLEWMHQMGVPTKGTRAEEIEGTDVMSWAQKWEVQP